MSAWKALSILDVSNRFISKRTNNFFLDSVSALPLKSDIFHLNHNTFFTYWY